MIVHFALIYARIKTKTKTFKMLFFLFSERRRGSVEADFDVRRPRHPRPHLQRHQQEDRRRRRVQVSQILISLPY
jgi:hypothetical protein